MNHSNNSRARQTVTPPLRVFLVEDSADVRALLAEDLAQIPGLALTGFADTENDALQQLRRQAWDILILDIQLSQGNGIHLLRKLSEDDKLADKLKIIFSNHVGNAYRRISEQYGVRYFFDKSSDFLQLHCLLEQFGSGASLR
ncbi:response regulator [Undibacterium arcticum]|uniref:Response regulator n=1 Tax=Undibacterium arcticum TaxID=1762892 RepID=A0ABV7F8J0_9BURK